MERRAQMVINTCTALAENPIAMIHDVGAGGLSNALPERKSPVRLLDHSNIASRQGRWIRWEL